MVVGSGGESLFKSVSKSVNTFAFAMVYGKERLVERSEKKGESY